MTRVAAQRADLIAEDALLYKIMVRTGSRLHHADPARFVEPGHRPWRDGATVVAERLEGELKKQRNKYESGCLRRPSELRWCFFSSNVAAGQAVEKCVLLYQACASIAIPAATARARQFERRFP